MPYWDHEIEGLAQLVQSACLTGKRSAVQICQSSQKRRSIVRIGLLFFIFRLSFDLAPFGNAGGEGLEGVPGVVGAGDRLKLRDAGLGTVP